MYLLNYDFYDLHAFITFVRNSPERFPNYIHSVEQIIEYINAPVSNECDFNTIRRTIRPYFEPQDEALSWILVNNIYTANVFAVKKEPYYLVLSAVFKEMLDIYFDEQRLCFLCDAVHNIPLLLADESKPTPIINTMIKDYRKQYNKLFLVGELKNAKLRFVSQPQ